MKIKRKDGWVELTSKRKTYKRSTSTSRKMETIIKYYKFFVDNVPDVNTCGNVSMDALHETMTIARQGKLVGISL